MTGEPVFEIICFSTSGDKVLGDDSVGNDGENALMVVGVLERAGGGVTANVKGFCDSRLAEGVVGDCAAIAGIR